MTSTLSRGVQPLGCTRKESRRNGIIAGIAVALLAFFCFFFRLNNYGLIDAGEAYYPAAVREMLEAHSYIVPQLNYQVYFSKPILTFWLMGASYKLFGINELTGRLMPALAGVLLVLSCYSVTRRLSGSRAGFLAAVFICSAPFMMQYYRISPVDAFFATSLCLSLNALLLVVSAGESKWWPAIYVCLGLAVLTKGPAAILLFGAGCLAALAGARLDRKSVLAWRKAVHPFKGLAILLAVSVPWFVAIGQATNGTFYKAFFLYENIGRFNGHTNPGLTWNPWIYLLMAPLGLGIVGLLLPAVYAEAIKVWQSRGTAGGEQSNAVRPVDPNVLCVWWSAAIVVLFSLSKTQLYQYILPAMPPLAMATAMLVEKWSRTQSTFGAKCIGYFSLILAIAGPLLAIGGVAFGFLFKSCWLPGWASFTVPAAAVLTGVAWVLQRQLFKAGLKAQSIGVAVLAAAIVGRPMLSAAVEYSYNRMYAELHMLCQTAKQLHEPLALYGIYLPSVMYYTERPVNCFFSGSRIVPRPGRSICILVRGWQLGQLRRESPVALRKIDQKGFWTLCQADGAIVEPTKSLAEVFSHRSVNEILADKLDPCLTDCVTEGDLWRGDPALSSRH